MIFHTIAQTLADNSSALFAYGPLGIVCAWLMFRMERVFTDLRDLSHRIDGLTRAMLVDMTERESAGPKAKEYAREAIAKIDARNKD